MESSILTTRVQLAVDDFGSGYSSLSQLMDLPVHIVKLDRKFVESVATNDISRAVVRAVVELASTLGLSVVAEGIETAEQGRVLCDLGCGLGQGYYFARPVSGPDLANTGCKQCSIAHLQAESRLRLVGT